MGVRRSIYIYFKNYKERNFCGLFKIRIQSSNPKVNIRVKTNLLVPAEKWLLDRNGVAFANFLKTDEGSKLNKKIIKIQDAINYKLESGVEHRSGKGDLR